MASSPDLAARLRHSIALMGIEQMKLGQPELVAKEREAVEKLFSEFSKATPPQEEAYRAARALLRGDALDEWDYDTLAAAVSIPIREQGGRTVLGSPSHLGKVLAHYQQDVDRQDFWQMTWYFLLCSYLTFGWTAQTTDEERRGFAQLRDFLARSWPVVDATAGEMAVPDWLRIMRSEHQLLGEQPVERYVQDFLAGRVDRVQSLAHELKIPPQSWFWNELVLGGVRHATRQGDAAFKALLPLLIELVQIAPMLRDEAVAQILQRYHQCQDRGVHPELRDFVIRPQVWKNPKLKPLGQAPAWNQVPEAVWRMVLSWVNKRNLRDFFDVIAARRDADKGRFAFWSRYMEQISWTRLVFGAETRHQVHLKPAIRKLLEAEEGAYAQLNGTDGELDAFLMEIGNHIFVEFSKKGNGAYGYAKDGLRIDLYAPSYRGSTSDLKYGYYKERHNMIAHTPGWEERAAARLAELGIHPDRRQETPAPVSAPVSAEQQEALQRIRTLMQSSGAATAPVRLAPAADRRSDQSASLTIPVLRSPAPAPSPAPAQSSWSLAARRSPPAAPTGLPSLDMAALKRLLAGFPSTQLQPQGGAVWVYDPRNHDELSRALQKLGFKWSVGRSAWYWRDL